MDVVIKTLRGLLNTTPNGMPERQLWRDFRGIEGYEVPYKSYGYRTFIEFLQKSNEFDIANLPDGVHIRAKLSKASIHLAEMVQSQNRSKKKRSERNILFTPRLRSALSTANWGPRTQTKPPFTARRMTSNTPVQQSKPFFNSTNRPNVEYSRNASQTLIPKSEYKPTVRTNPFEMCTPNKTDNLKAYQNRMRMNKSIEENRENAVQSKNDYWDQPPKQPAVRSYQLQPTQIRPNFPQQNEQFAQKSVQNVSSVWLSDRPGLNPNIPAATSKRSVNDRLGPQLIEQELKTASTSIGKSVFDRLGPQLKEQESQTRSCDRPVMQSTAKPLDSIDFVSTNQPSKEMLKELPIIEKMVSDIKLDTATANDKKLDPKMMLEIYCKQKNFDLPKYSCKCSKSKKFVGEVEVEGVIHSTNPIEYSQESDAQNAAASVALENIKEFPISRDSCDELSHKIHGCIGDNGVFLKFLPNIFEQKYEVSLPESWENIIQNRPEMFSIDYTMANYPIVWKNALFITSPKKSIENHTATVTESRTVQECIAKDEEIENFNLPLSIISRLPWDEPFWTINVTWAISTVDVWGRIIDTGDWDNLCQALEEIEIKLSHGEYPQVCHSVVKGNIYLVLHKKLNDSVFTVYRVRIEAMDDNEKKALCFYIDDGFDEWISYETRYQKLYQIDSKLRKFPAQACQFSLFNLEDFAENPDAKEEVSKQLSDKIFKARVTTTQEQFEAQLESDNSGAKIVIKVYDDDDVLMNRMILENICAQLKSPKLEANKTSIVHCTYVSDIGEIYCRLHGSNEMHTIKQIIHRLTRHGILDTYRVNGLDLNGTTSNLLRLVFDKSNGRWYRAVILPSIVRENNMARCKFVDYGRIKYIEHENIYSLERLSMALSKYPHQTIIVRLDRLNGHELSSAIVQQLRDLLCCHKAISMKMVTPSEIPLVDVWKIIDKLHFHINFAIRKAIEFENSHEVPLPDDSFSSDDEDDHKQTDLPLHSKLELHQIYQVKVITAVNPTHFFLQLSSDVPIFTKMMDSLWKDCENYDKIFSKNKVKANHFYAARLQDGFWHRVKVLSIASNDVVVLKWDHGEIDKVSIDVLRPLSLSYRQVPQLIFPARLYGLQPRQKTWDKDDCNQFQSLTVGKPFKAEIKHLNEMASNGMFVADVVLLSPFNTNISEQLVREHRAKYV